MGLYLAPFSGWAAAGRRPDGSAHVSVTDAPPDIDALEARKRAFRLKGADPTPPNQIPGPPPPYTWYPLERSDWRLDQTGVIESLDRARLYLLEDEPRITADPIIARREMLHRQAATLREKIAKLRDELKRYLAAAKQRDSQHEPVTSGVGQHSPLSGTMKLPKLPRARRPIVPPQHEAVNWGVVKPGTPLRMTSGPMKLGPITGRIVQIRSELSRLRVQLAQIRQQLKELTGKRPLRSSRPTHQSHPSIGHKIAAVHHVRRGWLGHPRTSSAKPVSSPASRLRGTTWTRRPKTESYNPRKEPKWPRLRKGRVKLTPEERSLVMKREAIWHHGPGGAKTPAVWKSMVDGEPWYVTNTHRAYNIAPTLKEAIARYHAFIKSTA